MNTNRFRRARFAAIPFAVLTLVACGGGGDSPPSAAAPAPAATAPAPAPAAPAPAPAPAPAASPTHVEVPQDPRNVEASGGSDINASNYASLGRALGGAAAGSMSNPLVDGNLVNGRESRAALGASQASALSTLPAWIGTAAARMSANAGRERAAAVQSDSVDCPAGGTMTVTVNDADDNNKLSAGDSVKFVANQCANDAQTPPMSGGFELGFNAIELNGAGEPSALDASGRFVDLRTGTAASLDGAFRIWAKADASGNAALRLSLRDVTVTQGSETIVFNIDLRVATKPNMAAMAIDGGITVNGQTYSLVQVQPFTIDASGTPTGGALRMTDAQGDAVLMRAGASGRVDYDFIPAGSSVPADTTPDPRSPRTPKR